MDLTLVRVSSRYRFMRLLRKYLPLLGAGVLTGILLGLFRYDDGCLDLAQRMLLGVMNCTILFIGAVHLSPVNGQAPAIRLILLKALLIAGFCTGLSALLIAPLIAPDFLRGPDYLFLFFVPGLATCLGATFGIYLYRKNRELAGLVASYSQNDATPGSNRNRPIPELPVAPESIVYISGQRKRSVIHSRDGDFEMNLLLKALLPALPQHIVRIHKSYAINLNLLGALHYQLGGIYTVSLLDEDDTQLPVGRTFLANLRAQLTQSPSLNPAIQPK